MYNFVSVQNWVYTLFTALRAGSLNFWIVSFKDFSLICISRLSSEAYVSETWVTKQLLPDLQAVCEVSFREISCLRVLTVNAKLEDNLHNAQVDYYPFGVTSSISSANKGW